ncbi:cytochrome ubiquinol oxidase subunit I [Pelosinus sp. IPA-1]|uniref:cytochrome ubiquinol oxidase subunit I n=1 Tax=Pelosinus sp. IPA-1 TaxID=3029569 RepID=UPI0024361AB3|nr:cytochrome ubiquinol oxidase subunit I [Pelosinus sp. IPA-1]GMB01452.1 cytochrome ubiquinol oxidase subunit I [Pelosinus sp. IPA-1]
MDVLLLARWQFAMTTVYHFLFVPLTLGLSVLVAVMETLYVQTGNEMYKKMTMFWGKLFLVNFSMGVVTGIVQEFHFGMNWAEYSRFMGDIFGAPLALEALTAFFIESTFLGLWIFGWERLSKRVHLACIWLVAFASNLSAFWILVANSFMQSPVGYALQNGRAEMTDFLAVITNPYVWGQFPHTVLGGLVTAGVFVTAISAYYLLKQRHLPIFRMSIKVGLACMLVSTLLVMGTGHLQAQYLAKKQPMKMAAMEALWESADPAPFAIAVVVDEANKKNSFEIGIPKVLSLLAYDKPEGEIKGINELQAAAEMKYGPGNYTPSITQSFWTFRIMVLSGLWMMLLAVISIFLLYKERLEENRTVLKLLLWSLPVPYIANSTGWILTEGGRQPWIVVGLQKVSQAVSTNVTSTEVWISLIGFTVIYGVLAIAAIYLVRKFILEGPVEHKPVLGVLTKNKEATLWN